MGPKKCTDPILKPELLRGYPMFGGRDSLETPRSPSCPQTTPQPPRRIRLPTSSLYSWACAKWTPECHRPWPAILHLLRPRTKSAALPDRCGDVVFLGPWCSLGIADTPQLNQLFANWEAHPSTAQKHKCGICINEPTKVCNSRDSKHSNSTREKDKSSPFF